jgi:hypothetical protein
LPHSIDRISAFPPFGGFLESKMRRHSLSVDSRLGELSSNVPES